jgi:hypothetical protein
VIAKTWLWFACAAARSDRNSAASIASSGCGSPNHWAGWRAALHLVRPETVIRWHHIADLVSVDFFVVPTATFRVLYVFVILLHHRRQIVRFNVTDSPTAAWTA